MSRRTAKRPPQLVPSTQSGLAFSSNQQMIEWATQAQQNNSKQRVPKSQINPLNSTQINLNYKRPQQSQQPPAAGHRNINFMHKVPHHQT